MGKWSFLREFIKKLDDELIKHNINRAKPPRPNPQTDTSKPGIPTSLKKIQNWHDHLHLRMQKNKLVLSKFLLSQFI